MHPQPQRPEWWRHAVVYQIYVRSFADGNGDGTGDIAGIRSRLPYLAALGIDAIWVNPWYRSPLLDGGYDVADYREIDERFGTTADAEAFIAEAGHHGIRVLVDLVPNHSSWEHRWFVEALAAPPGSPARSRYHFLPGRGVDGELPPNDWPSVFGGSAWTRAEDGEWYLHLFDESQPDVNWEHPEVRAEFESVMRFWLDRGAAGFRIDVAHSLVKAPGYPDLGKRSPRDGPRWTEGHPFWDRDEIHPIVRSWRKVLDEYDERMMVAEAWVRADRRPLYLRPDEYQQAFDFDLMSADWDVEDFVSIIANAITSAAAVGSNPTWVLSNHDVMRHTTRYGLPHGTIAGLWPLDGPHDALDQDTRHPPGAGGCTRHARPSRIGLRVPGGGTRPAGRVGSPDRCARRPPVGGLRPHREGSRWLSGADPVGADWAVARLRDVCAVDATARAIRTVGRFGAGERRHVDAAPLPSGDCHQARASHGRLGVRVPRRSGGSVRIPALRCSALFRQHGRRAGGPSARRRAAQFIPARGRSPAG